MRIRTKITLLLMISLFLVGLFIVLLTRGMLMSNQTDNLRLFKNQLLTENTRLIEDSSHMFFDYVEKISPEKASRKEILEHIKKYEDWNSSVVVLDMEGKNLSPDQSGHEMEPLMRWHTITRLLEESRQEQSNEFTIDNYRNFLSNGAIISPQKIYFQVYNSPGLIIGYGQTLENLKTRLEYVKEENGKNYKKIQYTVLTITMLGIIVLYSLLLFLLRSMIFRPLQMLDGSFARVTHGDLMHRAELKAGREINRIAESFNNMTEKLQDSVNEVRAINIQLESHSRNLEHRVANRTRELSDAVEQLKQEVEVRQKAEKQLLDAKREAESASQAKTQFVANMSHEIRTPMNAIIGMSELALETTLTAEQEECITIVKSSANSLLTLLNDILDFSKIEVGKLDIEPIEFSFRESLGETAKNLSINAHKKDLELIYNIAMDVPNTMVADPGRLRQVITNLIGNSIKFTSKGIILLNVEIGKNFDGTLAEDEIVLHFSISDTGIGIPKDKQYVIFEKFTQKDSSITRRFGGTGLGLTISKQLVQLMGGDIWVESPGDLQSLYTDLPGSTFHFTVVLKTKKGGDDLGEPIPVESLIGMSALVVDDNSINRNIFKENLSLWGMKPEMAASGQEALEILEKATKEKKFYNLVLMDVQMPAMNGFEVVETIRKGNEIDISKTQVIVLTAAGLKGDGKRCRDLGIAAYLKKPIRPAELLDAISIVMGNPVEKKKKTPLITTYNLREKRKPLKILVAEDNAVNQKLIRRILEKRGANVTLADNGEIAVKLNSSDHFDIILMDIQMPEMDGVEATIAIRKREKENNLHRIPIVALTAHAMKGDKERFLEAGMDTYVSKPIKQSLLLETIGRLVPIDVTPAIET